MTPLISLRRWRKEWAIEKAGWAIEKQEKMVVAEAVKFCAVPLTRQISLPPSPSTYLYKEVAKLTRLKQHLQRLNAS